MCEALRPHSTYTFLAPTVGHEKSAFSASYCISVFIFRRCPYSPYDFVQVFARDLLTGAGFRAKLFNLRATLFYLRAGIDPPSRDTVFIFARAQILLRATLFYLRAGLDPPSRDTVYLRAGRDPSSREP